MRVREARVTDAQAILALHLRTIRGVNRRDYSPDQIERWAARQSVDKIEAIVRAGEMYVCVDDEDTILGFGSRRGSRISGLYVAADCQGQGVGSQLLARLEADAVADGIAELELNSTLTAEGFYLRQGYESLGPTACFGEGESALPAIAMRKRLTA